MVILKLLLVIIITIWEFFILKFKKSPNAEVEILNKKVMDFS